VARQSQASADLPATETIPWCAKKSKGSEAVEWLHPAITGHPERSNEWLQRDAERKQDQTLRPLPSLNLIPYGALRLVRSRLSFKGKDSQGPHMIDGDTQHILPRVFINYAR